MKTKAIGIICIASFVIFSFMTSCTSDKNNKVSGSTADAVDDGTVADAPSREAKKGFKWKEINGAGLRFFAQSCDTVSVVTDASVPGVRIERTRGGKREYSEPVIRVFTIEANFIESLLPQLRKSPRIPDASWLDSEDCEFKEVESGRVGVTRYVLQLTGHSAELLAEKSKHEPVPYTCGGWGLGSTGMRYFEVFSSHPDKVIFVEEGNDSALIDEKSIEPYDIVRRVKGTLIIGHEVRSFTADGDSASYWIVDGTDKARLMYRETLGASAASYAPVNVDMEVLDLGRSLDGFSEQYDGVYMINKIISMKRK